MDKQRDDEFILMNYKPVKHDFINFSSQEEDVEEEKVEEEKVEEEKVEIVTVTNTISSEKEIVKSENLKKIYDLEIKVEKISGQLKVEKLKNKLQKKTDENENLKKKLKETEEKLRMMNIDYQEKKWKLEETEEKLKKKTEKNKKLRANMKDLEAINRENIK